MSKDDVNRYIGALELDLASLYKLLGGTDDERLRFWEHIKGITRPAELTLASYQLQAIHENVKLTQKGLQVLTEVASQTERGS